MLDATTGLVDQDRILAERIEEEGRACVIALNKWDLVPQKDDKTYLKAIENIQSNLPALRWADVSRPLSSSSALNEAILLHAVVTIAMTSSDRAHLRHHGTAHREAVRVR